MIDSMRVNRFNGMNESQRMSIEAKKNKNINLDLDYGKHPNETTTRGRTQLKQKRYDGQKYLNCSVPDTGRFKNKIFERDNKASDLRIDHKQILS